MGKVTWHGDAVRARIESEMGRRLKSCGQVGRDHAQTLVSVDGTTKVVTKTKQRVGVKDEFGKTKTKRVAAGFEELTVNGRNGKQRIVKVKKFKWQAITRLKTVVSTQLLYNTNPSKPGEPPHVQTGRLRASVAYEVEGKVARIGTNVIYGRHLELGTSKMAPRPWLRRMLAEMTPTFRAILTAPIKGGGKP